jgi:DNA-binding LacI/PurR family transcriptional regulator
MPNVSDQRRSRVLQAAARLGYGMDASARRLRSRRSGVVGGVISDMHSPVFAEIADGIRTRAQVTGHQLLCTVGDRQFGLER